MRSVKPSSRKYLGGNVYARSDENSEQVVGLCVRLHVLLVVRVVVDDDDDDETTMMIFLGCGKPFAPLSQPGASFAHPPLLWLGRHAHFL